MWFNDQWWLDLIVLFELNISYSTIIVLNIIFFKIYFSIALVTSIYGKEWLHLILSKYFTISQTKWNMY